MKDHFIKVRWNTCIIIFVNSSVHVHFIVCGVGCRKASFASNELLAFAAKENLKSYEVIFHSSNWHITKVKDFRTQSIHDTSEIKGEKNYCHYANFSTLHRILIFWKQLT